MNRLSTLHFNPKAVVVLITTGVLVGWLIWFSLWWAQHGLAVSNAASFREVFSLKQGLLMQRKPNGVTILSGSNSLFGLSASGLSSYMSRPVVNGATIASAELPPLLRVMYNQPVTGEIVLLPLEPHFYAQSFFRPGRGRVELLSTFGCDVAVACGFYEYVRLVFGMPVERLVAGLLTRILGNEQSNGVSGGPYEIESISVLGDVRELEGVYESKVRAGAPSSIDFDLNTSVISQLSEFSRWMRSFAGCIAVAPPARVSPKYVDYVSGEKEILRSAYEKLTSNGVCVVGDIDDSVYDLDLMYDSPYHLNSTGRKVRTRSVGEWLTQSECLNVCLTN